MCVRKEYLCLLCMCVCMRVCCIICYPFACIFLCHLSSDICFLTSFFICYVFFSIFHRLSFSSFHWHSPSPHPPPPSPYTHPSLTVYLLLSLCFALFSFPRFSSAFIYRLLYHYLLSFIFFYHLRCLLFRSPFLIFNSFTFSSLLIRLSSFPLQFSFIIILPLNIYITVSHLLSFNHQFSFLSYLLPFSVFWLRVLSLFRFLLSSFQFQSDDIRQFTAVL